MKGIAAIAKYIDRLEVVEAVNQGSVEGVLDALEHYARVKLEGVGVSVRFEGSRPIVEDRNKLGDAPVCGEDATLRRREIVRDFILSWAHQLEGVFACREALARNDAKAAALHMTRAMLGLVEHERQFQELTEHDQRSGGGEAGTKKRAEKAGPVRQAARRIRANPPPLDKKKPKKRTITHLPITEQARIVHKALLDEQEGGEHADATIPSAKTLEAWFREDNKLN